jgi:hypothetical protein
VIGEAGLPSPGILLNVIGHAPAQLSGTPGATKVTAFNTTPLFSCGSGCAGHYGITASSMDLLLSVIALALLAPVSKLRPVEEDHRFADGQFLGYLADRCQRGW